MKATDFSNVRWNVEQVENPGEPDMYGLWTVISDKCVLFLFVDGDGVSDPMNCEARSAAIGRLQYMQGNASCNLHVELYDEDEIPF